MAHGGIDINEDRTVPAIALLAMQQSAKDLSYTTSALLDSYRAEIAELRATLALIREGVGDAMGGRYMPTSAFITSLLYPDPGLVRKVAAQGQSGTEGSEGP